MLYFLWLHENKSNTHYTLKCVLVHFGFHYILNDFGHFYHGKTNQPLNERGIIVIESEMVQVKYKFIKSFHLIN
jgi:hypothetical protein